MLLTIDAGNTNISFGIFEDEKLIAKFRFTTKQARTPDELSLQIHSILEVKNINEKEISDVVISSVVPNLNNSLSGAVKECFGVEPLMVAPGIKTGISLIIEDPKSCGADLIVDVVAAHNKYPNNDCVVADFGTASKFLFVNSKGEFKYAVIAPGLEVYANTLWQSTAQLPQVQLQKPASILNNGTVACMQSGIVYGYIGLTEGIINQIKKEIGHDLPVIATGGLGRYLVDEVACIDEYDPDLAYKGMKLIYKKNRG